VVVLERLTANRFSPRLRYVDDVNLYRFCQLYPLFPRGPRRISRRHGPDNSCIGNIRYTKIHPSDRRQPTPLIDPATGRRDPRLASRPTAPALFD
jgi:hypothetical protein